MLPKVKVASECPKAGVLKPGSQDPQEFASRSLGVIKNYNNILIFFYLKRMRKGFWGTMHQ